MSYRYGQLIMDNVELYNCSQWSTEKACIRIKYATEKHHSITNSSFHGHMAWGFTVQDSANVNFVHNDMIGGRQVGLVVHTSHNVTIDDCYVGAVWERPELEMKKTLDKVVCYSICAWYNREEDDCYDVSVTNSVAAGCPYAGFVVPGHDCDTADT